MALPIGSYSNSSRSGDVKTDQQSAVKSGFDSSGFSVNTGSGDQRIGAMPTWLLLAAVAVAALVAYKLLLKK